MYERFSFWVEPDNGSDQYYYLSKVIENLAERFNTSTFVPHVTIIGGKEMEHTAAMNVAREMVKLIAPYKVNLRSVGCHFGTPTQILFSKVLPTAAVKAARDAAISTWKGQLQQTVDGDYFPHLSLAYGDLKPKQVSLLKDDLASFRFQPTRGSFVAQGLSVWKTPQGQYDDWEEVAKLPFL